MDRIIVLLLLALTQVGIFIIQVAFIYYAAKWLIEPDVWIMTLREAAFLVMLVTLGKSSSKNAKV